MTKTLIYPSSQELAKASADRFVQIAGDSIRDHGFFSVALSGGSTPLLLFKLLAAPPYREQVAWNQIHFFWGDERCVPPDHPENNYHNANEALLKQIPIPLENIHRIQTEYKPEEAALRYEETLLTFFSGLADKEDRENASFDLVLLGMGEDGHTASLFPGTPAIHETSHWVAAQYIDKLAAWRVTLTPALLNRAKRVIFLVAGSSKSDALQHILYGIHQPDRYPAQVIQPASGELFWLIDEAAASLL